MKFILSAIAICFFFSSLFAQSNIEKVKFDFGSKQFIGKLPTANTLRKSDFIQIEIINLPSNTYRITISKSDSVLHVNNMPALFGTLNFGENYTKILANLADFAITNASVITKSKDGSADSIITSSVSDLLALKNFDQRYNIIQEDRSSTADLLNAAKAKDVEITKVLIELKNISRVSSINTKRTRLNNFILTDDSYFNFFINNAKNVISLSHFYNNDPDIIAQLQNLDLKKQELKDELENVLKVSSLIDYINSMRKNLTEFHFNFKNNIIDNADELLLKHNLRKIENQDDFEQQFRSILTNKKNELKKLEDLYNQYYDVTLPKYDLIVKSLPLSKADSMVQKYRKDFYSFASNFDSLFNSNLLARIYKEIKRGSFGNYVSLPYPIIGDITKLKLSIDPLESDKGNSYLTELYFPNPRKYKIFWSFTSGVFVGGLKNEAYSWKANVLESGISTAPVYDTLNYSLTQESVGKIEAGITALLHVGSYFDKSDIGWHLTFGPGLTMEKNPRPRIMIGAGLVFGRTHKVALTAGWYGGQRKKLIDAFDTRQTYPGTSSNIIKDKFKGSWFVSLSYALFGK